MAVASCSLLPFQLWISAWLLLVLGASSFNLPPQDIREGDMVRVKINGMTTSMKTRRPLWYYSIPHCEPVRVDKAVNIREDSPYSFRMLEWKMCKIVCRIKLNATQAKDLKEIIDNEYRVMMVLDHVPDHVDYEVGWKGIDSETKEEKYYINNHLDFTVKYHRSVLTGTARIVGFEAEPFSIRHQFERKLRVRLLTCDPRRAVNSDPPQEVNENKTIIFTYNIDFMESDVSSLASVMILLFLSLMVVIENVEKTQARHFLLQLA